MLAPSDGDFVLHAGAPATAATKRIVVTGLIDVVALMYITQEIIVKLQSVPSSAM